MYIIIRSLEEEWKLIDDPEIKPIYEISNYGNVRNINTGKLLKHHKDKDGYDAVSLMRIDKNRPSSPKRFRVCRLVAKGFISNPNKKPTVNHLNGTHDDDYVENLDWATYKEQIEHAAAEGLRANFKGSKNPGSIYDEEFIHNICKCLENGIIHTEDIMKKLNLEKEFYKNKKRYIKLVSKLRRRINHHHITCLYDY